MLFFYRRMKSVQFWPQSLTPVSPVAFEVYWFIIGATYRISKPCIGSADDLHKYYLGNFTQSSRFLQEGGQKCKILHFRRLVSK